jgi:hypothetical protein
MTAGMVGSDDALEWIGESCCSASRTVRFCNGIAKKIMRNPFGN